MKSIERCNKNLFSIQIHNKNLKRVIPKELGEFKLRLPAFLMCIYFKIILQILGLKVTKIIKFQRII